MRCQPIQWKNGGSKWDIVRSCVDVHGQYEITIHRFRWDGDEYRFRAGWSYGDVNKIWELEIYKWLQLGYIYIVQN